MNKHYPFPKIRQFHQVVRDLKLRAQYVGKDENGNAIYDGTLPLPVVSFVGYEKQHGCVAKGTMITLANGSLKEISEIKIGTSIVSFNIETHKVEFDQVKDVIIQELDKDWVELEFENGIKLSCTQDHPLYTRNRGWVKAIELKEADDIVDFSET